MSIIIYPYTNKSGSVTKLKKELGCKVMASKRSSFKGYENITIINWGNPKNHPSFEVSPFLNHPDYVRLAIDKYNCLEHLKDKVRIPRFTSDPQEAIDWLLEDPKRYIVCRTLTRASGGRGIILANDPEDLPDAPLYTLYVRKRDEYRIHVFNDEIFDVQRKMQRTGYDGDYKIRSYRQGYVLGRVNVEPPQEVKDIAVKAVHVLGLHFGAVDVLWQENTGKAYVLEVNTAPGLEGTTLDKYVEIFRNV